MEKLLVKAVALVCFSACLTIGAAGAALAHVEVSPGEVSGGGSVAFTVSVPTELDIPTAEVRVEIPAGFEVESVDEAPGWRVGEEEEAGRIAAITWSGGEIPVEGSEEFAFQATAPEEAGEFPFRATQTYEDGTVVEWAGPEDSNEPAPIVAVTEGTNGDTDHEGHDHGGDRGSNAPSVPLPDSGGAGYAALGAGLAMMLFEVGMLRRRP